MSINICLMSGTRNNDNKKLVYVAVSDINTGEILKSDMVEQKSVYTSQPDESFITQADFGKSCMIDITKEHILSRVCWHKTMWHLISEK